MEIKSNEIYILGRTFTRETCPVSGLKVYRLKDARPGKAFGHKNWVLKEYRDGLGNLRHHMTCNGCEWVRYHGPACLASLIECVREASPHMVSEQSVIYAGRR